MNTVHELDAIVAGVDGSQAALQAVRWAAAEARNMSCTLRLVHTLQWPLVGYPIPPGLRTDWTNEMHEQGCEWLRQAEATAKLTAPEVQVQVHLRAGDPRQCLLTETESARELVVGSRGLGGSPEWCWDRRAPRWLNTRPAPSLWCTDQGLPTAQSLSAWTARRSASRH